MAFPLLFRILFSTVIVVSVLRLTHLPFLSKAQDVGYDTLVGQGTATYFSPPYTPSYCFGDVDDGNYVAGVRQELVNEGAACGDSYLVTCFGGTNQGAANPCRPDQDGGLPVVIVDGTPAGYQGTINLSQDAFSILADLSAESVSITYQKMYDARIKSNINFPRGGL